MQSTRSAWQETSSSNGALRDVPPDRLQEILSDHELWVESGKTQGKPADLTRTDLEGQDLRRRNLAGACLHGANLRGAILDGTILRGADLRVADLSTATGLLSEQLAGANLCRAVLPQENLGSDELATVAESSRSAQTLLWSMLGGCIYAWLTIWTTTDTGLLTNRTTSTLPIIGGTIPIGVFFVVMPLVLLGLYLYLHFQLQRLWEGLTRLPAVFPDGRPLDRRVDLWLLSSCLRCYSVHLREGRGDSQTLLLLQKSFALLLVWGVVPITFALFWGRYLAAHHPYGTAFHVGVLMAAIGAGVGFKHLMVVTLSSTQGQSPGWNRALAAAIGSGVLLALLSFGAISGIPPDQYDRAEQDIHWAAPGIPQLAHTDPRRAVPLILDKIGVTPFADFEKEVTVAPKPPNWTGENKAEIDRLEAVNLMGRNLQHAKAARAFLARADMRWTDLTGANLREAQLHGANLEGARLERANVRWAKLRWATLLDAKLTGATLLGGDLFGADLRRADLQGVDLTWVDLRAADLHGAKLQLANLSYANFQGHIEPRRDLDIQRRTLTHVDPETGHQGANLEEAILLWANLTGARLQAVNLQRAWLQWATLQAATLQEANLGQADLRWANLSGSNLRGANLFGANLQGANLQGAHLGGANLFAADLRGADLANVTGMTVEQLEVALFDEATTLPDHRPRP